MKITKIPEDKKQYLDILLLGDEQESMIETYLDRGDLFALYDDDLKTVCVVTKETETAHEIKNIATREEYQGKGYGSLMLNYVIDHYKDKCAALYVGTGNTERTLSFYRKNGFEYSHTVKDFFTKHYDHVIVDDGVPLRDMIYLKREYGGK
ncbi:MAG: GNAT family N-acetyltransferase [Spirochaetaceae bacterium]|jgi:GNAT superfamily N-acetyltransferase|nr:GNAT family N-acetyltransferase [Spirochaetaceae bacterium]